MSEIELELISDYDVYLFVEKSMKGGTSYIAEKINKADNKNMRSYVNSKPRKYIAYLDGSNSYFSTMSQYLLFNWFKGFSHKEIYKFDVNSISKKSSNKYILESVLLNSEPSST